MKAALTLIGCLVVVIVFVPASFVLADPHDPAQMVGAIACVVVGVWAFFEGVHTATRWKGKGADA